jgi:hypothetical protein
LPPKAQPNTPRVIASGPPMAELLGRLYVLEIIGYMDCLGR